MGRFIVFEGVEGSGKTTQLALLAEAVRESGSECVITKEPGGTPLSDRIRAILLDSSSNLDPLAELFLFAASRRQNVVEVIRPALDRGSVVLCDRFTDATLAYQGFGRLLNLDQLRTLNEWATGSLLPDLTLIFDLPEEIGLKRARSRNAGAVKDEGRFEAEDIRFHRRVREGYRSLAVAEPNRFVVIDGEGDIGDVFARVVAEVRKRTEVLR